MCERDVSCPLFVLRCVIQLEEQLSRLQREKNELQSRMEEDQEDLNELMKKHKAAVAQVSSTLTFSATAAQHVFSWLFENNLITQITATSSCAEPLKTIRAVILHRLNF